MRRQFASMVFDDGMLQLTYNSSTICRSLVPAKQMRSREMNETYPYRRVASRRSGIDGVGEYDDNDVLDVIDELSIALSAISDIRQSIQQADTKSGMLGALLGLIIAGTM